MIAGAWLCLVAPLAGAVLITLLGTRLSSVSSPSVVFASGA